ncbi:MAG TPA: sulfite exporter TauE/SafE family protein [Gemmatimonadales bacterium]|nr:sulfite exporter TauE/SafE family protein [Gemmatimonadales bacterium]
MMAHFWLAALAALLAATLAAVTGFGGAAVLLPVLVAIVGVRAAIPVLTVAQLIGNGSRVWFNRGELDWRLVGWFSIGALPCGILGGMLFAAARIPVLLRLLGLFLVGVVLWRRFRPGSLPRVPPRGFAGIGGAAALVSALTGSVGPVMAPFFLSAGLVKGAYIGTEALATVVMHVAKLGAYRAGSVLPGSAIFAGLALGPMMIVGSWIGKRVVDRLPERIFVALIEVTMVGAGIAFLARA